MKTVIIEQAELSDITEQDHTIKDITKSIYIRKAAKNPNLICTVTVNTGDVTKGFTTMDQLAKHIYGKYGKQWNNYIHKKNKDTSEIATHGGIKPLQVPDIYGISPILFRITYYDKTYLIYDSPHDGSCMYHSLSAVMHALFQESTLSATALKKALVTFYSQRGEMCNNFRD